jgi:hypothetical protein
MRLSLALLLATLPSIAAAQGGLVTGLVRDSATGHPLAGTVVTLAGNNGYQQSVPTEQNGTFRFTKAFPASYTLSARRLGYSPWSNTIHADENSKPFTISMAHLSTIDTVIVRPGTGIYGEVGTLRTLQPLRDADIQIIGVGTRLKTDASGRFFLPLRNPGTYVVRARVNGYELKTVSVLVNKDETADLMILMDSSSTKPSNAYEMAWNNFSDRARLRGSRSAIVSRLEILQNGNVGLMEAIERASSVSSKNLRFGPTLCLFVDGLPASTTTIGSIDAESIEAVEVYTSDPRSDETHSLARASRGSECHATGLPGTNAPDSDVIKWVVVWLVK